MAPVPPPELEDACWPVIVLCNDEYVSQYTPEQRAYAEALAGTTMHQLSGYRVGGCPITVRPCAARCAPPAYFTARTPGALSPSINANGAWVNACGCPPRGCSCSTLAEVRLEAPVGWVEEVRVDGAVLPETAYRVDDDHLLVRTDGQAWPVCQDMEAPITAEGTFAVRYLNALRVSHQGAVAAGALANEFAAACTGGDCQLPKSVTQVVRQGITLTLETGVFPDRRTGIQSVDAYLDVVNPHKLVSAPVVMSPDYRPARRTTWP